MRADQWKKVVVVADLSFGCEPALLHVALGTIRSELAQMNIRVAIVAILANIGEFRVRMALRARQVGVSPSKRELRLTIVIEPKAITDGTPASGGMATGARNRQPAMRVVALRESDSREGPKQNYTGQSLKNNEGIACQRPGRS